MPRTEHVRSADGATSQVIANLETSWRQWRAFIAEKEADLQAQRQGQQELDSLTSGPTEEKKIPRANIPNDVRAEFNRVLDERRQRTQQAQEAKARQDGTAMPEPDQVLSELLVQIRNELEGRVQKKGLAIFWRDGQMVTFDQRTLNGTTTDDFIGIATRREKSQKRQMWLGAGACLVVLVVFVGVVVAKRLARASANTGSTIAPVAQIGPTTAPLWAVDELRIGDVSARIPKVTLGYPIRICVPAAQQPLLQTGITVTVTSSQGLRTYRVQADATTQPQDAVFANCVPNPPKSLRSAVFVDVKTSEPLDPKIVQQIVVVAADVDPASIPADRMQVTLHIKATDVATGTMILPDGSRYDPSYVAPQADGQGVAVQYLVPAATTSQVVGWEVRSGRSLPRTLKLQLPAPLRRGQLLREALTVGRVTATMDELDGQPVLRLTLPVTLKAGNSPLSLLPEDVNLQVGRQHTPITDATWDPPLLQAGTKTPIEIVVPLQGRQAPLEATFGPWHARLTW